MKKIQDNSLDLLASYYGQLIDVKRGNLKELVIVKGRDADLLMEIIREAIKQRQDSIEEDSESKEKDFNEINWEIASDLQRDLLK